VLSQLPELLSEKCLSANCNLRVMLTSDAALCAFSPTCDAACCGFLASLVGVLGVALPAAGEGAILSDRVDSGESGRLVLTLTGDDRVGVGGKL
jgi:hypothetical protein